MSSLEAIIAFLMVLGIVAMAAGLNISVSEALSDPALAEGIGARHRGGLVSGGFSLGEGRSRGGSPPQQSYLRWYFAKGANVGS